MKVSALAGKQPPQDILVNIPQLVTRYYTGLPDPAIPAQQVSFGTSGHRGTSLENAFNEDHILAIAQAICLYRQANKINGPLFLGFDTHALSSPAFATAMEVLAANEVSVMITDGNEYTPTPAISHAILTFNKGRKTGLADGIVLTPSHNPPGDGGFKYNPPNGGPAANDITKWIEEKANEFLSSGNKKVKRISFDKALNASTTHRHDYLHHYINDLSSIINMDLLRDSKIAMGVDPLGGAGIHYWEPIAERYKFNLSIINKKVDPTFSFMTVDWDGQIRMDPSSSYAMQGLLRMKDQFDISFACDTDHDRHGIVTKSHGLLHPNAYLSVAIDYLLRHRPGWPKDAAIGKTLVSSSLIDHIVLDAGKKIYEVPVGFKWFTEGLLESSLCFAGEESAGASLLRSNGQVWTTDKDGIVLSLLAGEITASTGKDPGQLYEDLSQQFGHSYYDRQEAKATPEEKEKLKQLSSHQIKHKELAGEKIVSIITKAPANQADMGGIKVSTQNAWFAARPSGTENIYKIYAESFVDQDHLNKVLDEANHIVNSALKV
ncbi:MAG TPA: phosphoglucomutase (alpha-D-glucose-1,6-bisphosphate-dependent) [Saprospiraceae bacterium]|nr:phosphoglucomutase (alpha-D-glucose-1,6-bisphosphate-dependent) [Saprospiraceae bacterium]